MEKQLHVGGLWNKLPPWQDIQNKRMDFSINKVPLKGVKQKDIQQFAQILDEQIQPEQEYPA